MKAIECKHLSKSFKKKKVLDNINLTMEKGKIYALLGRNSAGKTTLLNCLCTRYLPDEGEVYLLEEKAYENQKVLREICLVSDYMEVFSLYKVKNILHFAQSFYEKWDEELMHRLLDYYEIDEKNKYAALSKGKRTVISIIIGLCSGCEIVLFDEIYSGMDTVARKQFYEILLEQQEKKPRTFVLSTHLIEEMSGLFTDVILMDHGKILLAEDMEQVHERSYCFTGRVDQEALLSGKCVLTKNQMGSMMQYCVYDNFTSQELQNIKAAGMNVSSMNLQDLFIACTTNREKHWN